MTLSRRRLTAIVFLVYGDDSADEKKQRVAAISGVVGTEQMWRDLEMSWIARTKGVEFHAKDCESDHGNFACQAEEDSNIVHRRNKDLYKDLTTMLANSGLAGIGIAIDIAAQKQIFPEAPVDLAYYKAFLQLIQAMGNFAKKAGNEISKFTFDINTETNFNAAFLYRSVRENEPDWAPFLHPELSFVPAEHSPRVQTGDLVAYEAMKALDHVVGPVKRHRLSWQALLDTRRFTAEAYSIDWFNGLRADYTKLERRFGMTSNDYHEWLRRNHRQDNISNKFQFMDWKAKEDAKKN